MSSQGEDNIPHAETVSSIEASTGRLGLESKQADWKLNTQATAPIAAVTEQDKVITGDIFPHLLNQQVGKYEQFMGDADILVPETILERPRKRLKGIEKLRDEIMAETEDIQTRIVHVYQRLHENVYSEQTDEGYLEIEIDTYEKCYHVDLNSVQSMLDQEVIRLRNEYKRAQEEAKRLIEQMESFLKQNHTIVQDFLKTTHKAIVSLAKPTQKSGPSLTMQPKRQDSEGGLMFARGKTLQNSAHSMIRPSMSTNTAQLIDSNPQPDFWVPQVKKLQAFGPMFQNRFEWPTLAQLKNFDLRRQIKLIGMEIGASSNLYGIRMHFTNNVSSPYIRASHTREQDYQRVEMDMARRVTDVYISQDDKSGNIQGLRLVDDLGNFMFDQFWDRMNNFVQQNVRWKHFRVPPGHQLIGVHGSDDGTFIKSLGFTVWQPNPEAVPVTAQGVGSTFGVGTGYNNSFRR